MLSCLDAGDEVLIPEPFYANYNGFARMAGVQVVPVPTRIEDGFALPPLADWEPLISARTKAVLICHPNNPTGVMYTRSELQQLSELVRRHNLFLFSDEVYRMFAYDGATHHSVLEWPELADHAVVVESVSKVFSACGARIGALLSRNSELMAVALKYGQARLSPPTLEQLGAEAALSAPASYFEQVRSAYEQRRNLVVSALRAMPGVVCPHPGGHSIAWCRFLFTMPMIFVDGCWNRFRTRVVRSCWPREVASMPILKVAGSRLNSLRTRK